jgi:hypothetical protein
VWLPGVDELGGDPQIFYRAMDFLLDCDEEVRREVFGAVADLVNLEVELILFDTTSIYFEIEAEDGRREFGKSKDHRDDLPQVVVGMAVTKEGIPVRCFIFPGKPGRLDFLLRKLLGSGRPSPWPRSARRTTRRRAARRGHASRPTRRTGSATASRARYIARSMSVRDHLVLYSVVLVPPTGQGVPKRFTSCHSHEPSGNG